MRTPICDSLGIEYPIFAFSHCRDVVAAVTNAGGFGVFGATAFTPEALDVELDWIDEHVAGRPYGVDILFPARYVGQDGGLARSDLEAMIPDEHRRFVDDLLERYDVPPLPEPEGRPADAQTNALMLTPERLAGLTEVTFAHPIRLVANALGPPPLELVEQAHARDVLVASLAGTVAHAERNATLGIDVHVAQGTEAGGHTGEIATMVLVPEVVDAVAPTPVLAAGGIARGRQLAAALALGAQGAWTGSVWLTTDEAETHPTVQRKLLRAASSETVRSRSITGKPARQLETAWTDEWESPASPGPLPMPLQPLLVEDARRRIDRAAEGGRSGAVALANYFVGQVVGSLDRVRPARRVVQEMVEELADTVALLTGLEGDALVAAGDVAASPDVAAEPGRHRGARS